MFWKAHGLGNAQEHIEKALPSEGHAQADRAPGRRVQDFLSRVIVGPLIEGSPAKTSFQGDKAPHFPPF